MTTRPLPHQTDVLLDLRADHAVALRRMCGKEAMPVFGGPPAEPGKTLSLPITVSMARNATALARLRALTDTGVSIPAPALKYPTSFFLSTPS